MIQNQKNWSSILITRISKSSTFPKFQLLLFINFCIKWSLAGMILFSLNFFYITPEFQCSKDQVPPNTQCQDYVCSLSERQWLAHLSQPIPKSISLDYGILMLCSNKWLSSLLQSFVYIGSFLGYILMPYIAEKLGQKLTERISWMIAIIGLSILVLSLNLQMVGISSFLIGLGINSCITLHYTFLKCFMVGSMKSRSFLILQVLFSVGVSLVALSSMAITQWKIIAGFFMLLPCILIMPFNIWLIQQTPHFSIKSGQTVLLSSLNKIAKINGEQQLIIQDLQFIPTYTKTKKQKNTVQYSIIDLYKYKSLRYIAIICPLFDAIIEFVYDGTILSLDKIGINVYLNQILVGFVEIFASIFTSWIIIKVKRKQFIQTCLSLTIFITIIIGILTLIFKHRNNQINTHVIFEMILLGCLRFTINCMWGLFFVFISQLFPNNVLSLTFGLVSAVGTLGAFCSPFIRLATANATMFFMAFLCVIALVFLKPLKQTKGQKGTEEIEQRLEQNMQKKSIISQKDI